MTNKIFSSLKVITLAIVLSFGLSYVYAWTAPTVAPTGGNVLAPLNTSGTAQTKAGGLNIATGSGKVGIGVIASDPNSKLEVKGGNFSVAPEAGTGKYVLDWPNGNGSARIRMWDQFGNQGVYIASDHNSFFKGGNVGIGTVAPIRALHVNGELSMSRSDKVGFINISDETGNGSGTLYLRGLSNSGSTGAPATIILEGTTYVNGGLYVNGTPITGGGAISCTWTGERGVYGNITSCGDDMYTTCTGGVVTSMRMGC